MKKFEDLSKADKEKLSFFLQYNNFLVVTNVMTMLFALLSMLVGIGLIFIFTAPVIIFTGGFFAVVGYALALFILICNLRERKHLFLIFGYKNTYKDVFNISNEDIKKVKIIREVKWIKGE